MQVVIKKEVKEGIENKMEQIRIEDDYFFKISNSDQLRPFFMSIVSDSDHWMFIGSNGGISTGRRNAEYSLFPYYTDDKIIESQEITGSKTIFRVDTENGVQLWEPFSQRTDDLYALTRNLYKSVHGNKVLFEEINHDLGLSFSYKWSSSDLYGFVRQCSLNNHSDHTIKISALDGIQNILPYGVGSDLQNRQSNLVDAYKRSELVKETGLGIYALSAIIVDKAEPSEALKANIVWSKGLENPKYLLSSLQLPNFRKTGVIETEYDIKAEKGAYFIATDFIIQQEEQKKWLFVANVNQNHSNIVAIAEQIQKDESISEQIIQDIEKGTQNLIQLVAASDGLQMSQDRLRDTRHFSNTLFNIMRGGIFDDNYWLEKEDFIGYLRKANKKVYKSSGEMLLELPEKFTLRTLRIIIENADDKDFIRLCMEYMPLKFSRRHGDPSRPWNRFSINLRDENDGSKILDYEGNWRDIYQNWEALAHSYPEFVDSMIFKFLNASTFDGYNPYRITKDGFDWEIIEPDDPWSYIGYWGDHQIIYLLKFLEFLENRKSGKLANYFNQNAFVYANVPYRIKSYGDILKNPKDTIDFDFKSDTQIRAKRNEIGADGALLNDSDGNIHRVNFMEKILATVLSKLSNFIPEAGIWMNTQRPEWNDANNALVGNGVSMVTLYYLRRFLKFFQGILKESDFTKIEVSSELFKFFNDILSAFDQYVSVLTGKVDNTTRKQIMDALGQSGSNYRLQIYQHLFSGKKESISKDALEQLVTVSLQFLEHSIKCNKRKDGMYDAYNLMTVENDKEVSISHLSEMLEGQVAVLSSGYLSSKEAVDVLDALKSSDLFREDQYSYLLYPAKELPLFMERNTIPHEAVENIELFQQLLADENLLIIEKDVKGEVHFNGNFKNAKDVELVLDAISGTKYAELLEQDKAKVLQVFEDIFDHKSFTGRSGTFYGYEGLGSIYWHMVSKLLLAVEECCLKAVENGEDDEIVGRLLEHFYEINEGIGVHKSPSLYGAFPTDPYSHTPTGKGAQQPGMTGQVKEDILSRFGELGVFVKEGKLHFAPCLLRREEFLKIPKVFEYLDTNSSLRKIKLEKDTLSFTYCQTPIIYRISEKEDMEVILQEGSSIAFDGLWLDEDTSKKIFERTGEISLVKVNITEKKLR